MNVAVLYGSQSPPGRLSHALMEVKEVLETGYGEDISQVNLGESGLSASSGIQYDQIIPAGSVDAVSNAEALVVLSPTYKAGLPGIIKIFLDTLDISALKGKVISLIAMGENFHHYLGVDMDMRKIAAWFGAYMLPSSLYLTADAFNLQKEVTSVTRESIERYCGQFVDMSQRLNGSRTFPGPDR